MVRMKPLVVKWMMTSWKKLKTHTVMIKKGWTLPCLDAVMNPDVQRKAMAALLNHSLSLVNDEQREEPQSISESDMTGP